MGRWKLMLLNMGLTALYMAVNDPALKPIVKPIALEIFRKLKEAFFGDPDFQ